jgi:hypothetical protein
VPAASVASTVKL